jgi:hypothetical protein
MPRNSQLCIRLTEEEMQAIRSIGKNPRDLLLAAISSSSSLKAASTSPVSPESIPPREGSSPPSSNSKSDPDLDHIFTKRDLRKSYLRGFNSDSPDYQPDSEDLEGYEDAEKKYTEQDYVRQYEQGVHDLEQLQREEEKERAAEQREAELTTQLEAATSHLEKLKQENGEQLLACEHSKSVLDFLLALLNVCEIENFPTHFQQELFNAMKKKYAKERHLETLCEKTYSRLW